MARPFGHVTILEGANEMELSQVQAESLVKQGLIYHCPRKDGGCFENREGCGFYHVSVEMTDYPDMWDRLIAAIPAQLRM